ncbi:hypothetical protein C3747_858g12 [Trypanosoma cruzi]|uniref:SLACS reverse transcriptase n=1 Tax=Trypanosoma cruzi TaxID=5693 RepID=A0A2V2UH79_TRYCR|nr:hypothetical protein C3747_858g12 [Trypanosoma cruzi]
MANGNVAPEVAHRLRATNLTVLRKPNKKFRPIGAECVWAKAISLMAVDAVMPALKTCFKNLQYGVGNNIELAIEKVRQDFRIKGSVAMLGRPECVQRHQSHGHPIRRLWQHHMEPTVAGHTTPAGHGRAGGLLRKGTIGSTRGRRRGECDRAWCWDGAFFHRHHRHPPPTGKQLPQRQLHGVPGRRYGGGTTGHAWAGMRGDIQGDACPGHRDERGQDGGPPYRRTSGHARGVHPAVCPRARCGNSKRPRERADYAVCATQGGGDRPPVPSNCGASICETHAVAAPVRVGAATRDVPPADACPSAHESSGGVVRRPRHRRTGRHHGRTRDEARTRHCGPPSAPRRVRSPTAKGDCGVAYACLGEKGKQHALTDELDAKHQSDLYETLQGPDRKVFVSNTAAGAGRPLTDRRCMRTTEAFPPTYGNDYWCACCRRDRSAYVGQTHPMSTCTHARDSNKPADHTPRHDQHDVRKRVATMRIPMRHGTATDGGEPAATGHPHRGTRHVRDHRT